jgi:hypothetical protein
LDSITELPALPIGDAARFLAKKLIAEARLPIKAQVDALHVAVATVNGMDYLLTWNCRHIANATLRNFMSSVCQSLGYDMPVICTPDELIKDPDND